MDLAFRVLFHRFQAIKFRPDRLSYLSRLKLINKCNQNVAVPMVIIPKPSRVDKRGQFPQISINAAVEAFKFAKI